MIDRNLMVKEIDELSSNEEIADYVEQAIKEDREDRKIDEDKLWQKMLDNEGIEKRVNKALEELDELTEQLELVKYKPTQKLNDKEKIALRDEIVDVFMMLSSLMVIFHITPESVYLRRMAKTEAVRNIAYKTNRTIGLAESKGESTYAY